MAEPEAPADESSLSIPKYRFDEVNQGYREALEQNRVLLGQLQQLTQVLNRQTPQAQAAEPVQLDEREQRIVSELDRLLQHSPTWQRLAPFIDKADVLMRLADEIPAQREHEARHWQGVAHQWLANVLDAGAKTFIGAQARVDQLEPERADMLRRGFTTYVSADPQRVARYEAGDRTLVNDFIGWFRGWVAGGQVDPQARRTAAAAQARAEAVRKLPTSGPAGQPVSSAPPKINNKDEEAVHSAGWQAFQREVAASR